jgi:hypothetical protein
MANEPLSILLPSWNHDQSTECRRCKEQFKRTRHDLWRFDLSSGQSVSILIRYSKLKLHTLIMQINHHNWFQTHPSCCYCWISEKEEFILTSYPGCVIQSIFYSPKPYRSALRFTEHLTQRTTAFSPGNKATGCETDNSAGPIAEVKEDLSSNSNPPVDHKGLERDELTILVASEN